MATIEHQRLLNVGFYTVNSRKETDSIIMGHWLRTLQLWRAWLIEKARNIYLNYNGKAGFKGS
jgi:hypothetical protein